MNNQEFWDAAFLAALPFHIASREETLQMPNMRADCVEEAGYHAARDADRALRIRNERRPTK